MQHLYEVVRLLRQIYVEHLHVGVEHIAGDMFESVPKGDAIFLNVRTHFFYSCIQGYILCKVIQKFDFTMGTSLLD